MELYPAALKAVPAVGALPAAADDDDVAATFLYAEPKDGAETPALEPNPP